MSYQNDSMSVIKLLLLKLKNSNKLCLEVLLRVYNSIVRLITTFLIALFSLLGSPSIVSAHPGNTAADGCHYCRTNCDKWGVPWNARHCHGGGFQPPPTRELRCVSSVGDKGSWTFSQTAKCSYDIKFTWDKGTNDELYSLVLSKKAGADPGPNSDTSSREFTFYDVKPGIWYINMKTGSSSCSTSKIVYWKVEVPDIKPTLAVREEIISETDRKLLIDSYCASSVTSDPPLKNLRPGLLHVGVFPKKDTTYVITAKSGKEKAIQSVNIKYPLPTPTATPAPKIEPTAKPRKSNWILNWLF